MSIPADDTLRVSLFQRISSRENYVAMFAFQQGQVYGGYAGDLSDPATTARMILSLKNECPRISYREIKNLFMPTFRFLKNICILLVST